jgi:putative DNA primase/helicase
MLATAGCIAALRQDDAISLEQQEEAEHLAALWASRWEGPHPSAYEDERAKFRDDWSQQDVANLGWRWLRDFATQHGVQGLREEEARSEFRPVLPALEPAIDPRTGEELKNPIDVQDGTPSYADAMIARGVWAAAREVLAFDPFSERWMRWNGQRWLACSQTRGVEAEMIVRNLIAAYANRHGIEWSNTQMVQVATANRGPAVLAILRGALLPPQEFSHNALGLQTPTGSYDLRTGETVDAATARQWFDARCTAISPAAGETPLFDALLLHLCNGDAETVEWLWRCLGYGLLGDPRSQVFLSLVGEGATGKSTLLNVLLKIMGSYAGAIDADVLNTRGAAQHKASLFRLHDLRLAVLNEITKEGGRWNEARLKALTGGDEIEARQMHGPPRTFRFRGLLLVAGQKFPDFQQVDNAITRRVRIIGTEVPVPEHKRDTRLTDRLVMQEGPAILHRLIEQARLSYLDGCTVVEWPHRMRMTTNEIFGAMDRFVGWSQERLQAGPAAIGVETPVSDLRRDYQAWCSTQDEAWADDEMSEHRFTARLKGVAGLMVRNPDGRPLRKRFAHTGNNPVAYVKHGKLRDAAA